MISPQALLLDDVRRYVKYLRAFFDSNISSSGNMMRPGMRANK